MKLDSSTLFVNTGRKPLPAMQKKKKTNKNAVALVICIAIIAVLCVFVGLILHVWFNYNEEIKPTIDEGNTSVATTEEQVDAPKTETEEKTVPEEPKSEPVVKVYTKKGKKTDISKLAEKNYKSVGGTYSYGIVNLGDGYTYICNTDKVYNSAAMGAFLLEYVSHGIYMGSFDYTTIVAGHYGKDLMDSAFIRGSVEAANLLIEHFGVDKLNAYFAERGYKNTVFSQNSEESYTSVADLIKLMQKMNDNISFFPYSDMYARMQSNTSDNKISASLPDGTTVANISFETEEETIDAAIVNSDGHRFIFVSTGAGTVEDIAATNAAMAKTAAGICNLIKKDAQ